MQRTAAVFTILEVLIALIILGVGIVALAGSSALVTRMIGQGRRTTRGVQAAQRRLELLRQQAGRTTPACTALSGGSATSFDGIREAWEVATIGRARLLRLMVTYPTARGTVTDTLVTAVPCG